MEPYEFLKSAKDLAENCSSHYNKSKTLQKWIEENEEKYKACNEKCKTLTTSLDTVKTENTTLNKTCKDLEAALNAATREKNSLDEELNKSKAELEDTKEKLKLSHNIIMTMKSERDAAEENFAKHISKLMGNVFKPSTISDEDLSIVVSSSECNGKNITVLPKRSNNIIPCATSSIPSSPSRTRIPSAGKENIRLSPSSVAEIPNNRTTGAVSPILGRRDCQDFERSSSTSIPTAENKSKITFSPTTDKDNEKSNPPSPSPIFSAPKIPDLTPPAASLRKDDIGNKGSSISPVITLHNQSRATPISPLDNEKTTRSFPVLTSPKNNERTTVITTCSSPVLTSPKDNERTTGSSPIIFDSSNQNRRLQGILVTSSKKDNRDSPTSALPASENQSKAKSVTIEEKKSGTSPALVVNTQNNPAIIPLSLRSPLSSGNKEQNKTSTADSQNNQNITASALKGNVPTNLLLSSDRSSRSSLLLPRAQDLGNQLDERSLRGHNERKDSTGLKSDSITKSSPPIEKKAPVHKKEPNPEDLLSLHFPHLRGSPCSKTSVCNEDSNSGIMSVLDSEAEDEKPNIESVFMKLPIVSMPRIDKVTVDERNKSQTPRQSRKSKRTSTVSAAGPSKRRRSKSSPRE